MARTRDLLELALERILEAAGLTEGREYIALVRQHPMMLPVRSRTVHGSPDSRRWRALGALRPQLFSLGLGAILLAGQLPLFAQGIPPSGADPVAVACPKGPASGAGINSVEAWQKAREIASIEGDGFLGIGNWGHTREALEWYCKASAAGNAVAAYDIAEIFRQGYVVNTLRPGGQIITTYIEADPSTAFYWYELSANRGFTRGMLALARYYAVGVHTLKGSNVPPDPHKAIFWLHTAADEGDTTALTMLALRYAGLKTVPWVMTLPLRIDRAKALGFVTSAIGILSRLNSQCRRPAVVRDMINQLPDASEGRQVSGAFVVEVHGSDVERPVQIVCVLSLGGAPSSQQNEPPLDQFYRLMHGGAVSSWKYTLTWIPGSVDGVMYRETATRAMIEGMEEIASLAQLLHPSSTPAASNRESVNLAGFWEIPVSGSGMATLRIKQDGNTFSVWHVVGLRATEMCIGRLTSDRSAVCAPPHSDSEERWTIDGPDHVILSGGGELRRIGSH